MRSRRRLTLAKNLTNPAKAPAPAASSPRSKSPRAAARSHTLPSRAASRLRSFELSPSLHDSPLPPRSTAAPHVRPSGAPPFLSACRPHGVRATASAVARRPFSCAVPFSRRLHVTPSSHRDRGVNPVPRKLRPHAVPSPSDTCRRRSVGGRVRLHASTERLRLGAATQPSTSASDARSDGPLRARRSADATTVRRS